MQLTMEGNVPYTMSALDATVVVSRRATTAYGAVHMLRFLALFQM